jgi:hypothetical protein
MAATADGQKTIAGIFGQEKVAQETIKMMSVLGLIDEEALAVSTIFIQPTVRPKEMCTLLTLRFLLQNGLMKMVPGDGKQQPPATTGAGGSGSVPSHPNGSQAFPSLPPPSTVGVPPPGMGMSGPGQGGGVGFMSPPNPSHGFDGLAGGWGAPPQSGMMPPVPPPQQQQQPLPRAPAAAGGNAGGDISSLLGQSLSQEERVGVDILYHNWF